MQLFVDVRFFCVFCMFGRVLNENELFVNKVCFQIVVKVVGFSYVFENGCKCNLSGCPCFFVCLLVVSKLFETTFLKFLEQIVVGGSVNPPCLIKSSACLTRGVTTGYRTTG